MKKILISILTCFALCCPAASAWGGWMEYGAEQYESSGITVNYICRGISSVEDGRGIIVTAVAGDAETIIEVVDIDAETLLHTFHTGITGTMWYGCAAPDGTVYCCVGRSLIVYSPETKSITNAGYVPTTWSGNSNGIVAAEDGTVYGVTSAYGYVYQYKDGAISPLYRLPNVYAMGGVAVLDGYVYAGGAYNGGDGASTYVYKINPSTGAAEPVSNPLPEPISAVGHIYACGDHIIAQLTGYSGEKHAYFYNTKTGRWLDKTIDFNENGMSDPCGGKLFYLSGGIYHGIDVQTLEITDYPTLTGGNYHRGNGLPVTCEAFAGECFVNAQYNGNLYVISPEEGKTKHLNVALEEAPAQRRIARVGADGKVYVTAFMGSEGVQYDPETGTKNRFYIGQGEGAVSYGGKLYIGVYPGAEIWELDMEKPFENNVNPRLVYDIGDEQDRPFAMDVADGKLIVGTLPASGKSGGALTVIDLNTYEGSTYRNIIPGHSILTAAHKGHIIYCGTTVCGGAGSEPADGAAHVFSVDMDTGAVIRDVEFSLPGVSADIGAVHGLRISPYDGMLYGAVQGADFVMDPDTLEIVRYNVYSDDFEVADGPTSQIWHEYYMEFYDGYLFRTNVIIEPETLEIVDSAPEGRQFAGISGGKAYFVDANTDIYSIPIQKNNIRGMFWDFDDASDTPAGFAVNNKDIYRYHTQAGPSGTAGDRGFGWVISIGVGMGDKVINRYTNGFNILRDEIGTDYLNNTTIAVDMDFMIKNDALTAYLICPRFGAQSGFDCAVSLEGGRIYAGGQMVGTCGKDEWHNIAAVYTLSDTEGVTYDVYYDEKLVAAGLKSDSELTRAGVSCFCILTNADTTPEAFSQSNRYDTRNEILYIDNLYIGENTKNVGRAASFSAQDGYVSVNGGAYGGAASVFAAQYADGRLTALEETVLEPGPRETLKAGIPSGARVFVWDSAEGMRPLFDSETR